MRVVFMGTPIIAVPTLEALVADGQELVGVVTQPDRPAGRGREPVAPPVKVAALAYGLPVLQPLSLRKLAAVAELRALAPDAIVVVAFGQILRPSVLEIPRLGCLNVHPSLLPALRGPTPINGAILAGLARTGVTIDLMDAGMDTGPILRQISEPVLAEDNAETLGRRLAEIGAGLLVETLHDWAAGHLSPIPQAHDQATFTRMIDRQDGRVDWSLGAAAIERKHHAYWPWPGTFTHWTGKVLKLIAVRSLDEAASDVPGAVPGTVLGLASSKAGGPGGAALRVVTGEGVLAIAQLQIEGKRAVSAAEFARGQPSIIGARLG